MFGHGSGCPGKERHDACGEDDDMKFAPFKDVKVDDTLDEAAKKTQHEEFEALDWGGDLNTYLEADGTTKTPLGEKNNIGDILEQGDDEGAHDKERSLDAVKKLADCRLKLKRATKEEEILKVRQEEVEKESTKAKADEATATAALGNKEEELREKKKQVMEEAIKEALAREPGDPSPPKAGTGEGRRTTNVDKAAEDMKQIHDAVDKEFPSTVTVPASAPPSEH